MAKKKFAVSSKFLSLILRHKPELIALQLDNKGWANVDELIEKSRVYGKDLDLETLKYLVATNEKKRFSFNEDGRKIRANQGHSLQVDLGLTEKRPPDVLYHGTAEFNVSSILSKGLQKKNRHHVHLSSDVPTAFAVGARHGKPVVFKVKAVDMIKEGFQFFISQNGVWLTEEVPGRFLKLNK